MTRLIIDGVILLILAAACWRGRRAGAIPALFMLIGLMVAVFGGNLVAEAYSGEFTNMLEPFVSGLTDRSARAVEEEYELSGKKITTEDFTRKTLDGMGILGTAADNITEEICAETKETGHELKSLLVERLCVHAAYILTFAIAFTLIAVLFAVINNLINLSFHMPGLELVNDILGAVFGLLQGLLIAFFLLWLLRFMGLLVKEEILNKTILAKLLTKWNVLPGLLKL